MTAERKTRRKRGAEARRDERERDAAEHVEAAEAKRAGYLLKAYRRLGHRGTHADQRQREEHQGVHEYPSIGPLWYRRPPRIAQRNN